MSQLHWNWFPYESRCLATAATGVLAATFDLLMVAAFVSPLRETGICKCGLDQQMKTSKWLFMSRRRKAHFPSAQQFTPRAPHGCQREFIIGNAAAGLAVNGLEWLLTATSALAGSPQPEGVQPELREGSWTLEKMLLTT